MIESMDIELPRRAAAEFVGTAALVIVVVGSGIMASALTADVGLRLLVNSIATAFGLAVIILVLVPVSGAHLNPVVSLVDWWLGRRTGHVELATYLGAQTAGAV